MSKTSPNTTLRDVRSHRRSHLPHARLTTSMEGMTKAARTQSDPQFACSNSNACDKLHSDSNSVESCFFSNKNASISNQLKIVLGIYLKNPFRGFLCSFHLVA